MDLGILYIIIKSKIISMQHAGSSVGKLTQVPIGHYNFAVLATSNISEVSAIAKMDSYQFPVCVHPRLILFIARWGCMFV